MGGWLTNWLHSKSMPGYSDFRAEQWKYVGRPLVAYLLVALALLKGPEYVGWEPPGWATWVILLTVIVGLVLTCRFISKRYPYWTESYWDWKERKDAEEAGLREVGQPPEWRG